VPEDSQPDSNISGQVKNLPFYLVISSLFLKGLLFTFLNGPLMFLLIKGERFNNIRDLIIKISVIWETLFQTNIPLLSLSIILLLAIIMGMTLTPIERFFTVSIVFLINVMQKVFLKNKLLFIFSPIDMMSEEYVKILAYLFKRPEEKAHWEWELFHYYMYWSIATNLTIFGIISFALLHYSISFSLFILWLVVVSFVASALFHGKLMAKVHYFYRDKERNQNLMTNMN